MFMLYDGALFARLDIPFGMRQRVAVLKLRCEIIYEMSFSLVKFVYKSVFGNILQQVYIEIENETIPIYRFKKALKQSCH